MVQNNRTYRSDNASLGQYRTGNQGKSLEIVYILFLPDLLSVFGAETIKTDRYFVHILVTLFCHNNVGTSI